MVCKKVWEWGREAMRKWLLPHLYSGYTSYRNGLRTHKKCATVFLCGVLKLLGWGFFTYTPTLANKLQKYPTRLEVL